MTGVGELQLAALQIQNAHPRGDEHTGLVVFTQLFVGLGEDLVHGHTALRQILDDGLGRHHEHGRGDSLARNVGGQERHRLIVQLVEVVEISADLLGRDHLGEDLVFLALGEVGGEGGELDLLGVLQLLVDAGGGLRDVPFQGRHRRVDVVRQGGKLLTGAHVHGHVQVSLGDPSEGIVDALQVVDNDPLDEYVDEYEQRGEDDHLHEYAGVQGCVTHEHGFRLGHGSDDAVALNELEYVHIRFAEVGLTVHNIRIVQLRRMLPFLHFRGGVNADGGNGYPRVFVVDDDGQGLVQNRDEAARAHVTVLGDVHHELIQHGVELLGIVADLDEAAAREIDGGVLSPHRAVLASGTVLLYEGILCQQRVHELPRLLLALHIVADAVILGGSLNDTVRVDHVDLHDAVGGYQLIERHGRVAFVGGFHVLSDRQQRRVGFFLDIRFHVIDRGGKHLLRFDLDHSVLEDEGKAARHQIGDHDTGQQPALEGIGDLLVILFHAEALMAQQRHDDDGEPHGDGVTDDHGDGRALNELEGLGGVVHIGDEDQDHMDDLAHHRDADAVAPGGLLVVEHELSESRRHKAGQNGGDTARQLRVGTGSPVHREPAVQSADQTRDDTRGSTEDQTGRKRRGIAHVYNGPQPLYAVARREGGYTAEQNTDDDLLGHVRQLLGRGILVNQIHTQHQKAIQKYWNC